LQKNARQLAVEVIYRVNEEGGYSNLTLNQLIRKYDITDRDKALATQLVYGSLRMRNSLDWLINQVANRKVQKMDGWTRNILRLGLYQIQFLDGIPDAVACNETVELAKEYKHPGVAKFVNGVLRNILRRLDSLQMPSIEDDPVQHIRYKYSFPQWLVERWVKRYGVKATIEICQTFNQIPDTVIRRNPLKTSKSDLEDSLSKNNIEVKEINNFPQAFKINNYSSLYNLDTFQSGYFQIQGLASIMTGHIVAPKPGERVLDLCSAPGGKTTHLAELMDNQGEIIANELHEHKLSLIEENCKRLGVKIVNVKIGDGRKVEFTDSFDRILIDAPCSGLGMIAKKPEIKWQKKPQDIKQLKDIQLELLTAGSGFLKEGGELVYSTCTITEAENIEVVKEFVSNNLNFELVNLKSQAKEFGIDSEFINEGTIQLLPTWQENEGYFIAKLRRIS